MLTRFRIVPKGAELEDDRRRSSKKKTRQFEATCLAYVEANALWKPGENEPKNHRPVLAYFAGTEQALRPFVANLRIGHPAEPLDASRSDRRGGNLEFLRSVAWSVSWQHHREASVVRLLAPGLFDIDPGPRPDEAPVSFVALPSRAWVAEVTTQHLDEAAIWASLGLTDERREQLPDHLPALAVHWAARLDTRLRWPLVPDPRFAARLLVAALDAGLARLTPGPHVYREERAYAEHGLEHVGLVTGVGTHGAPAAFGELIAEHTRAFLGRTPAVRPLDQFSPLAHVG